MAALLDGSEWDCCAGEGGSKTKWLRAALLGGLQGGRNVAEGCAAR
jgi:hypothetical protein